MALAAANDSWESELTADDGGDMAGDDMDDVEYDEDDFNPCVLRRAHAVVSLAHPPHCVAAAGTCSSSCCHGMKT